MEIFVVRHGETTGDLEDRYGGDYDDHLTEKGILQAELLIPKLKNKGIEIIFSSPRIRAQETAKIINKMLNVTFKTIDNLRERNKNGVLTGLTRKEGILQYPIDSENVKDDFKTVTGAETFEDFKERAVKAFTKISTENYKTVLIIGHGGILRRIICFVLGKEKKIDIGDCALLEIDIDNNKKLELINTEGVVIGD